MSWHEGPSCPFCPLPAVARATFPDLPLRATMLRASAGKGKSCLSITWTHRNKLSAISRPRLDASKVVQSLPFSLCLSPSLSLSLCLSLSLSLSLILYIWVLPSSALAFSRPHRAPLRRPALLVALDSHIFHMHTYTYAHIHIYIMRIQDLSS